VLADHPPSPTPLSALYRQNRQLALRLRVFLDWISGIFAGTSPPTECKRPPISQ